MQFLVSIGLRQIYENLKALDRPTKAAINVSRRKVILYHDACLQISSDICDYYPDKIVGLHCRI